MVKFPVTVLVGVLSFTFPAQAEHHSADPQEFDLATVTCAEAFAQDAEDIIAAVLMVYGFAAGQSGQAVQSPEQIEEAVTSALAGCAVEPSSLLIEQFEPEE